MGTVSELQQRNARIVRQLRRSYDELDHFVRALSHDMSANFLLLESSFSQLKGLLDQPSPEVDEAVAHVDACLSESKQFLDDLVLLARTGSVQMEPSRVELAEIVDEVIFEQNDAISARRVVLDIQRPLPIVLCNRQRAKQVVTNLIRNAIRHGCDPHNPRITISASDYTMSDGWMVVIRVHDNGPGIDPRFHEEVFLPGRRLAGAAEEGSGMGLAIVKKIAEHYGGTVWVDQRCVEGTAIFVTLPTDSEVTHRPSGRVPSAEHDGPHLGSPPQPYGPFSRR